jgi:organic radical activating enzyme
MNIIVSDKQESVPLTDVSGVKTAQDIIDKNESSEIWFCPKPFDHLYSAVNGDWVVCCQGMTSDQSLNTRNTTPMEWLQSDTLNQIRNEILSGTIGDHTKYHCHSCIRQEKQYGVSDRTHHNSCLENDEEPVYNQVLDYIETGKFNLKERLIVLQTRVFGNQCNLDCYMCHPQNSTTRQASNKKIDFNKYIKFGDNNKEFTKLSSIDTISDLKALAPYISIFLIQGGEPLVMKKQFEFLDFLVEEGHSEHITLDMNSNMTVLGTTKYNILDYAPRFKNLNTNVSLEGIGIYNDYIRRRSDWDTIVTNVSKIRKVTNHIKIFTTVSILSVLRLDELFKWSTAEDIDQALFIIEEPAELHVRHLPRKLKDELITRFKDYEVITSALKLQGDPVKFNEAMIYIKATDEQYGTNVYDIYPELEEYEDMTQEKYDERLPSMLNIVCTSKPGDGLLRYSYEHCQYLNSIGTQAQLVIVCNKHFNDQDYINSINEQYTSFDNVIFAEDFVPTNNDTTLIMGRSMITLAYKDSKSYSQDEMFTLRMLFSNKLIAVYNSNHPIEYPQALEYFNINKVHDLCDYEVYPYGVGDDFKKVIGFQYYKQPKQDIQFKYLFLGTNEIYYREIEKVIADYPDHGIIAYDDDYINPELNNIIVPVHNLLGIFDTYVYTKSYFDPAPRLIKECQWLGKDVLSLRDVNLRDGGRVYWNRETFDIGDARNSDNIDVLINAIDNIK